MHVHDYFFGYNNVRKNCIKFCYWYRMWSWHILLQKSDKGFILEHLSERVFVTTVSRGLIILKGKTESNCSTIANKQKK